MKDLNRDEVYDLRGITHEQAVELLEWLKENDRDWNDNYISGIKKYKTIYFDDDINEWLPDAPREDITSHISTLFEKSLEEQLKDAEKKVDELKQQI